MTLPLALDHSHSAGEATIIYAVWLEIWPDLLELLWWSALGVLGLMVVVKSIKAYRRGKRRKGE